MSVYKNRPTDETYRYDFIVGGRRYNDDTGERSEAKARKIHDQLKAKAKAELTLAKTEGKKQAGAPMIFNQAARLYFEQRAKYQKNADSTLASLEWLEQHIGAKTVVADIGDRLVAHLVTVRRNENRRVGNAKTEPKTVGPATVNRTMTEVLRKVLLHVGRQDVPIARIEWKSHLLTEPDERVREATVEEEERIYAKLSEGYLQAVKFAMLTGARRMEVLGLKKTDVDFFGRRFTLHGKGDHKRTIPMSQGAFDLLWSLKDQPTDKVFTYVAQRTDRRKGLIKGQRYVATREGLKMALKRAVKAAGVVDFRFHDTRHTAASRVLRTSNIKVVQKLLGHRDISTTSKYAHAHDDDIRNALNAVEAKVTTQSTTGSEKQA